MNTKLKRTSLKKIYIRKENHGLQELKDNHLNICSLYRRTNWEICFFLSCNVLIAAVAARLTSEADRTGPAWPSASTCTCSPRYDCTSRCHLMVGILTFLSWARTASSASTRHSSMLCPKSNPNFRDITWNVGENMILQEIFRVVTRFPRYISCYIAEKRLPLGQWRRVEINLKFWHINDKLDKFESFRNRISTKFL